MRKMCGDKKNEIKLGKEDQSTQEQHISCVCMYVLNDIFIYRNMPILCIPISGATKYCSKHNEKEDK